MSPGSMPLATEIFQEGLILPPLKLVKKGRLDNDVLALILANVRTPEERRATFSPRPRPVRRAGSASAKPSRSSGWARSSAIPRSSRRIRKNFSARAFGESGRRLFVVDYMDDDGISEDPVRIAVEIRVRGSRATVDFRRSSPKSRERQRQRGGHLLGRVVRLQIFDRGRHPPEHRADAAVDDHRSAGPGRQRSVSGGDGGRQRRDLAAYRGRLARALAKAILERIPAASSGTMNNVAIGGYDPAKKRNFAYYETIGGGMVRAGNIPGSAASTRT